MNTQLCAIRIETLGCRLNQAEAESFAALCADAGFALYTGQSRYTDNALNRYVGALQDAGVPFGTAPIAGTDDMNDAIQAPGSGGFDSGGTTEHPVSAALIRFFPSPSPEHTVLCFVNTCTVTGKAEQKARRLIRLLVKEHPYAVILVTGCYAQLEAAAVEALHPHVLSFPGQLKDRLTALPAYFAKLIHASTYFDTAFFLSALRTYLADLTGSVPQENAVRPVRGKTLFALSSSCFLFHSRALLKIQDGCNEACAYCRIRLARGRSVSLPASEVIERLQHIERNGIPEVTLSGVNLSQYRSGEDDFAGLLKLILENSSIRLRISSLYPDRIDEALIPLLAHQRICPHFHLSVQSGSNTVLKAMHRSYTRDTVYNAVSELRRIKDNPFIGADIITGFPGETEADFEETYRMCRELTFAGIHAFPFSARPGTEAWKMQPKVPERIAGQRVKRLNGLAEKQAAAYLQAWNGKLIYGVTEAPRAGRCTVITENYLPLLVTESSLRNAAPLCGGECVRVRVCGGSVELSEIISRPVRRY